MGYGEGKRALVRKTGLEFYANGKNHGARMDSTLVGGFG